MTKWRSTILNLSLVEFNERLNEQIKLNNFIAADESEIPPWAKFEFDDKDWTEVNRHAGLPDDARRELESVIYSYLVFCLGAGRAARQDIKNKFNRVIKKTDKLFQALDDLLSGDMPMHLGDPVLIKHKAALADLRDWAAQKVEACGKRHPNKDPSARNRLISDAVRIYNGYGKTPFKDFRNREQFICELLEIAGVEKEEAAIKKLIREWKLFPRYLKSE